jgi:hypothetical protein
MMTDIDERKAYVTPAESAHKVRKALRAAFPQVKISVKSRSNSLDIEWEDTGPTVDELQTALKSAGLAKVWDTRNNQEILTVDEHRLWLVCFNLAKREAAQRDSERRQQEREAERQREQEALAKAYEAKRAARPQIPRQRAPEPEPSVYEAFERLREKAEAQVVAQRIACNARSYHGGRHARGTLSARRGSPPLSEARAGGGG